MDKKSEEDVNNSIDKTSKQQQKDEKEEIKKDKKIIKLKEELEDLKKELINVKKEHKRTIRDEYRNKQVKITFKRLIAYFIIYSFLGFIVETIFGLLTKGVIESRQSFLYGPLCAIYGVGAVIMIPGLQRFKRKNWTLALAGAIEGSILEYLISFFGEIIFHIRWWDYADMPFNINGRICILFTIFWGLLSLGLIRVVNPYIDKFIDSIPVKIFSIITIVGLILIVIDFLFSCFGLQIFYERIEKQFDLKIEKVVDIPENILNNKIVKFLSDNVYTNEKTVKTFPNIRVYLKNGKDIYVRNLFIDIQPYYYKLFDVKNPFM